MFQIQEFVGEAGKVCHIDEETAYGEDGLVVWQGRVAKCSEIPGLVYEASMQRRSSKRATATLEGGHRVCCPRGVSNREFLPRVCERIPPDVKGRRTARASAPRRSVCLHTTGSTTGTEKVSPAPLAVAAERTVRAAVTGAVSSVRPASPAGACRPDRAVPGVSFRGGIGGYAMAPAERLRPRHHPVRSARVSGAQAGEPARTRLSPHGGRRLLVVGSEARRRAVSCFVRG